LSCRSRPKIAALALATLAVIGTNPHPPPTQAEARGRGWGIGAGLLGAAVVGSAIAAQQTNGYYLRRLSPLRAGSASFDAFRQLHRPGFAPAIN